MHVERQADSLPPGAGEGEGETYEANGVALYCVSSGSGPAVLCLHGFPETHRSWDLQRRALNEAGYRVITPDLRGYGRSDKPARGYDMDTLAGDVGALIDALGCGPVRLVGHDWGGIIGWRVVELFPEKIVNATFLNAPHPALVSRALQSNLRQVGRSWYVFFFQLPLLPELWLKRKQGRNLKRMFRVASIGGADRQGSPEQLIQAEVAELTGPPDGLHGPLAYYRSALRQEVGRLIRRERPARALPIERPVTIIWGEEDVCLGSELLEGTERFASKLVVQRIADAGHFVHQEKHARVNGLLLAALARTDKSA